MIARGDGRPPALTGEAVGLDAIILPPVKRRNTELGGEAGLPLPEART